ncbi:hypothetical protein I4U23_027449 [Adineta vaga]|nr:hypothetical protein I4U23_027449 [Adineta vaga]
MCAYKKSVCTFPGVTAMKIRYQQLEIIDDQAHIFADVIFHELLPDEYNRSVQQVVNSLRPCPTSYWISRLKMDNQVLSCTATTQYHNIREFKALEERQKTEAVSETAVVVTQNDLASISSVEDVIKVAVKICSDFRANEDVEYHPTFNYHVVEDAILNVNGWENLRLVDNRYQSVEDNSWLLAQKDNLLKQFPWMSIFNPMDSLFEYGFKLLTLAADAKQESDELRRRMLSKALKIRISLMTKRNPDPGHTFCIAVLLIAIYQYRSK